MICLIVMYCLMIQNLQAQSVCGKYMGDNIYVWEYIRWKVINGMLSYLKAHEMTTNNCFQSNLQFQDVPLINFDALLEKKTLIMVYLPPSKNNHSPSEINIFA